VNNHSIPSTHAERKITTLSGKHAFTPHPSVSPFRQTDRMTDRETNTPAAHGLEELFSAVLERFLQPIHALHVYSKNEVGNTSKQKVNFYGFSC
jgi:hypothetical protein